MSPAGHAITAIAAAAALSVISGSGIGEMAGQVPVLLKALAENTGYFVCSADQAAALACLGILAAGEGCPTAWKFRHGTVCRTRGNP